MKHFFIYLALLCTALAQAQSPNIPIDPSIGESLFFIQTSDYKLETTLFKPDGAGPFPVAVINHGQA